MSPETIKRCFRKAGILDDSFCVVIRPYEHDSFLDIDVNTSDIESLMEQIQPNGGTCSCAEFINGNNDLVTCFETDDDSWDQQFLVSLDSIMHLLVPLQTPRRKRRRRKSYDKSIRSHFPSGRCARVFGRQGSSDRSYIYILCSGQTCPTALQ